jgi:hypothetical protein
MGQEQEVQEEAIQQEWGRLFVRTGLANVQLDYPMSMIWHTVDFPMSIESKEAKNSYIFA